MTTTGFSQVQQPIRRWAAGLALAGILMRALIPLGYMPGNVLDGEFMVLCPTGLPANMAHALHGHHDADQATLELDRTCPIGGALQYAALPSEVIHFVVPEGYPPVTAREPRPHAGLKPLRLFRVRAPPTATI